MATKKDLVEAYAFTRRRLVTAFVSGAPGGREVEPTRPGRTIVGGVALAVLLMAGAAIAGVFDKRAEVDWDQPGLVADDATGALYVILDEVPGSDEPRLRPVINVTSAQLILGSDVAPVDVPTEEIADQAKGPAIGIVNAPATVPGADQLVNDGWTACTGTDLGVRVDIAPEPRVAVAPQAGLVVRRGGSHYLVAQGPPTADGAPERAYSYRFPKKGSGLYDALGVVTRNDAIRVSREWLELFPVGGALDESSFDLPGAGDPAPSTLPGLPRKARIGDFLVQDEQPLMITADGYARLDAFSMAVLQHSRFDGFTPEQLDVDGTVEEARVEAPYLAASWPRELPRDSRYLFGQEVCAVLQPVPGEQPAVTIGLEPEDGASAEDTEPDQPPVVGVESGRGAMVWSGGWHTTTGGSAVLVDDRGIYYPLQPDGSTIENLGYDEVPETTVPDVWVELFDEGVELSRDAALCPPATAATRSCA